MSDNLIHKSYGKTLDKTKCGLTWIPADFGDEHNERPPCVRPWNGLVRITCPECNKYRPYMTRKAMEAEETQLPRNPLIRVDKNQIAFNKGFEEGRLQGVADGTHATLTRLSDWLEDELEKLESI